jgi:hypothetical protein
MRGGPEGSCVRSPTDCIQPFESPRDSCRSGTTLQRAMAVAIQFSRKALLPGKARFRGSKAISRASPRIAAGATGQAHPIRVEHSLPVFDRNTYGYRNQRLTDAIRHFVYALVLRQEYIRSISWRSMSCRSMWKKLDTHHRGDQRELGHSAAHLVPFKRSEMPFEILIQSGQK